MMALLQKKAWRSAQASPSRAAAITSISVVMGCVLGGSLPLTGPHVTDHFTPESKTQL